MSETSNAYTATWFDVFMPALSAEQTAREVAFLMRQLPLPVDQRVLDLCCGWGRHTIALAEQGYTVMGLDHDPAAITIAQEHARTLREGPAPTCVVEDMLHISELPGTFDAIINMWQSLSYFDEATNADLLRQMRGKLNPNGRLALDMYHRGFFEAHQGTQQREVQGVTVTTTQTVTGNRLTVHLAYSPANTSDTSDTSDTFEWQLSTPHEFISLADDCGFSLLLACANFDEGMAPTATLPRMQLVFERKARLATTPRTRMSAGLAPSPEAVDFIGRATSNPVFQSLMERLSTE